MSSPIPRFKGPKRMTCFPSTLRSRPISLRLARRIEHQSHNALRERLAVMVTSDRCDVAITPHLVLSELFRLHPETRIVFDRYGLRGCGGPSGPHESIRFFARAHGVDEPTAAGRVAAGGQPHRHLSPEMPPQRARCSGDCRYDLPSLLSGRDRSRALGRSKLGRMAALDDRPEWLVPSSVGACDQRSRRGPDLRLVRLVHHGICLSSVPPDVADDAGCAETGGYCIRAHGRGAVRAHRRHHGGGDMGIWLLRWRWRED